jgi:hypothetical protein
VRAFRAEKQEHWFAGLESTFTTFSGGAGIVSTAFVVASAYRI